MNTTLRFALALTGCVLLAACATRLRIHSDFLPEGSLRVAQVVAVGTRSEVVAADTVYGALRSSGIADADIVDGSVSLARVFCCGGPNEKETAIMMYAPPAIAVANGDIVEVRTGRPPAGGDAGRINTILRVRQKSAEGAAACRWVPPDPRLWARVIYCDWMPAEGWVEQGGISKAWLKPKGAATP